MIKKLDKQEREARQARSEFEASIIDYIAENGVETYLEKWKTLDNKVRELRDEKNSYFGLTEIPTID